MALCALGFCLSRHQLFPASVLVLVVVEVVAALWCSAARPYAVAVQSVVPQHAPELMEGGGAGLDHVGGFRGNLGRNVVGAVRHGVSRSRAVSDTPTGQEANPAALTALTQPIEESRPDFVHHAPGLDPGSRARINTVRVVGAGGFARPYRDRHGQRARGDVTFSLLTLAEGKRYQR